MVSGAYKRLNNTKLQVKGQLTVKKPLEPIVLAITLKKLLEVSQSHEDVT